MPARQAKLDSLMHEIEALQAAINKNNWQLQQRKIKANSVGVVEQVFYRQGEFVNKGQPILSVLLPNSQKVRFYINQSELANAHLGKQVLVQVDGKEQAYPAVISYIAKSTEYTPPVLYGQSSRGSLVFLVEAEFLNPITLNVGQPVDVRWHE
jgi:HlyD family secretion protein